MVKNSLKKSLFMVMALVLVCAVSIAGTYAYLSASTEAVTNTFTVGKLIGDGGEFVLKEHKAEYTGNGIYSLDKNNEVDGNTYDKILPGVDIDKDPFVRIKNLEVDAYLFLEVLDETGDNLTATIDATIWEATTLEPQTTGAVVYIYKGGESGTPNKLKANANVQGQNTTTLSILVNDEVSVDADFNNGSAVKISFKAYLCQYNGINDVNAAWTAVK